MKCVLFTTLVTHATTNLIAYIKGFDKVMSIDWHDAYAAMKTNAEKTPFRKLVYISAVMAWAIVQFNVYIDL